MKEWQNDLTKLLAIQNERHQKHNEDLQKQMAILEASERNQKQNEELRKQNEKLQKKNEELERQMAFLEIKNRKLEEIVANANATVNGASERNQKQNEELRKQNEKLQKKNEELKRQMAFLEIKNRKLEEIVANANATVNGTNEQQENSEKQKEIQKELAIQIEQQNKHQDTTKCSTSTVQQPPPAVVPIVRVTKFDDATVLRSHLLPVWQRLWDSEPECLIFRFPVDPVALNMPGQTIKTNLEQGIYKNPWEFCDHIWLMLENAMLNNRKNTEMFDMCTRMREIFIEAINPVMRKLGYCCGQKRSFTPLVQFCHVGCVIPRNQLYFLYERNSTGEVDSSVAERVIYCAKCFKAKALPEKGINLSENSDDPPNWIPKSKFERKKNDQIDMEPFEQCQICAKKWHRICAMHSNKITPEGFICDPCRIERNRPKPENKFTAKKLPQCQLSRFIEQRTNGFLQQKLTQSDPNVEVVIRVICNTDKEVVVKPEMVKKYGPQGYPASFPYRSKVVLAFEVVKDPETGCSQEICFFGLYLQEYGTNCAQPNRRHVNIAYLDSVHYFQPSQLRTSIYYEILLGYLEYAKKLGYTKAHIWAYPPAKGVDYIFHCHPPEQKIPNNKRLQDWYKTMLEIGKTEGTVHGYKNIFDQAKEDNWDTPMMLPYFEGDHWPGAIEECIIMNAEREEKNNLKTKGWSRLSNPSVVDRLFQHLKRQRDLFFTISLFTPYQEKMLLLEKPQIVDPDPLISCDLMDTRHNFLIKSCKEHWEFSELRRVKWSTLELCHILHRQDSYTCKPADADELALAADVSHRNDFIDNQIDYLVENQNQVSAHHIDDHGPNLQFEADWDLAFRVLPHPVPTQLPEMSSTYTSVSADFIDVITNRFEQLLQIESCQLERLATFCQNPPHFELDELFDENGHSWGYEDKLKMSKEGRKRLEQVAETTQQETDNMDNKKAELKAKMLYLLAHYNIHTGNSDLACEYLRKCLSIGHSHLPADILSSAWHAYGQMWTETFMDLSDDEFLQGIDAALLPFNMAIYFNWQFPAAHLDIEQLMHELGRRFKQFNYKISATAEKKEKVKNILQKMERMYPRKRLHIRMSQGQPKFTESVQVVSNNNHSQQQQLKPMTSATGIFEQKESCQEEMPKMTTTRLPLLELINKQQQQQPICVNKVAQEQQQQQQQSLRLSLRPSWATQFGKQQIVGGDEPHIAKRQYPQQQQGYSSPNKAPPSSPSCQSPLRKKEKRKTDSTNKSPIYGISGFFKVRQEHQQTKAQQPDSTTKPAKCAAQH